MRHDEPNIRPETSVGRTEDLTEHQFFHHLFISSILVVYIIIFPQHRKDYIILFFGHYFL